MRTSRDEADQEQAQQQRSFWDLAERPSPPAVTRRFPGPRLAKIVRERHVFLPGPMAALADTTILMTLFALLLSFFRPELLFSLTTTTGGDTGAHVYTPWYLKTHLLPKGMLSGWSPDWYAGFPLLHFYFPLVVTFQAIASYVIPYEIAFKLGTVAGTFFLPLSLYMMLRLMRLPFPTPAVGAVFGVAFLFMDSFTIYGGNIPSSLAGEYSFSLSVGLCFVFYGLAYRLATEDEGRPVLAAVTLAAAVLSHAIPVIMVVVSSPLVLVWSVRRHGLKRTASRFGVVFGLAFCLSAFWAIPLVVRLGYTADMSWFPFRELSSVAPKELWLYLAGAVVGAVLAALRRDRRPLLFLVPGGIGLLVYLLLPQGHVWNGRFIPFWYLGVFLTSAYAVGTTLPALARLSWRRQAAAVTLAATGVVVLASAGWVLWNRDKSFINYWIEYNYEGYEGKPAYAEFQALNARIAALPPGRVMWEPSPELGRFGTPIALMTLPYFAGHPTMEGIYFESSITTPFHFLTAAEVAETPSNPIPGLPYSEFDMEAGVEHLELMDVSYLVTTSNKGREAAMESPDLELIDQVESSAIFALEPSGQVVVPEYEPAVLEGGDWLAANLSWFTSRDALDVPLVRDGPSGWPRVSSAEDLPRAPLVHGGSTYEATMDNDRIAFTTDAVGEPHWIKTSYFPNWTALGAEGPYLASPSLMIVVPTQEQVVLTYSRTWAEWLGLGLTLGAVFGLMVVAIATRIKRWRSR
ncbi:MAG: 6-pyruvoyl-tetrahydropterin synthase-related protein [Actinomycetota bacterium]|nr:6-pyruvoyl-tetrahydropterin synthase-related protein [Actinomycetota bacterium]